MFVLELLLNGRILSDYKLPTNHLKLRLSGEISVSVRGSPLDLVLVTVGIWNDDASSGAYFTKRC